MAKWTAGGGRLAVSMLSRSMWATDFLYSSTADVSHN